MTAHARDAAPAVGTRHSVLTWLMYAFAIVGPVGVVVAFLPQLQEIGEVSHWPWEEYGFFGWWLVPLSLAIATVVAAARPGLSRSRAVWVLGIVTLATFGALFFNP